MRLHSVQSQHQLIPLCNPTGANESHTLPSSAGNSPWSTTKPNQTTTKTHRIQFVNTGTLNLGFSYELGWALIRRSSYPAHRTVKLWLSTEHIDEGINKQIEEPWEKIMNVRSWLAAWPCLRFTAYLHVFNMHEPQWETAGSAWVSSKLQNEDGCISGANKSTLKITPIALIFRESPNPLGFPTCSFHFCFFFLFYFGWLLIFTWLRGKTSHLLTV